MTIEKLRLHSEKYSSTGNIGENLQRLLGAPSLDPLQTVIREAVQNVADAGLPSIGPEIWIRIRRLTADQRRWLDSRVLCTLPREPHSAELLGAMRSGETLTVMEICDFGTVGLGGPIRSDRIPAKRTRTDFIDFLRNIGTARDTKQGGGTYGFGKVALYRASRCSTIIVDTLPHRSGTDGRRFMGCHLGRSFEVPENGFRCRYTGRHWWGVPDPEDGVVDPVTGKAAKDLASGLGFPKRNRERCGTSIMVLDFETNDEDLDTVGRRVVEGLLRHFWPRMMRDTPPQRRFRCHVEVNGSRLSIPSPEDFPPLDLFSKAMRAARSGKGNDVRPISSQRPAKMLGTLAIERGLRAPRRPIVGEGSLFPGASHEIALMRPIELVVTYMQGSPLPDERLEWAGVFVTSREEEVEEAFADSEPPAHDDWNPSNFRRGWPKTFVTVALRRLTEIAAEMGVTSKAQPVSSDAGPPLARVAGRLGAALEGVGGDGAERRRGTGRGRQTRPRRATTSRPLFERLVLDDAGTVAVFSTEVSQDTHRSGSSLVARAAVAVDGSSTSVADGGILQPMVVAIGSADGDLSASGDSLALAGNEGKFEIRVLVPDDCAVTVKADVLTRS